MNGPHRRVLSWIVEQYDESGQAVTPAAAATHFDQDVDTVRSCFDHLASNHLLASVENDGYRPTVTAREFLELDIDDETLLVLDSDDDE